MLTPNNTTVSSRQQVIYSDFTDKFLQAPFSGDLAKITNENSIKQSLKNICKTVCGERPYDNTIGATNAGLFNLADGLTESIVTQSLTDAITTNEPRVRLVGITTDTQSIPNALQISIYFTVANIPNTLSVDILIYRAR